MEKSTLRALLWAAAFSIKERATGNDYDSSLDSHRDVVEVPLYDSGTDTTALLAWSFPVNKDPRYVPRICEDWCG
ncbi:hypothetical protein M378DRAFT_857564 [Amanita muscaria Koide BX008]|uniref:Uncharacterized protein n=1 Tax=Amanita muscaria (strain Koide BX008) TaxID=946122 RepID=A0A0C2T485_AMAMK|nr:hypothetical protein M378DRAFT_857564 [Amanita muscaria Koide BX008]